MMIIIIILTWSRTIIRTRNKKNGGIPALGTPPFLFLLDASLLITLSFDLDILGRTFSLSCPSKNVCSYVHASHRNSIPVSDSPPSLCTLLETRLSASTPLYTQSLFPSTCILSTSHSVSHTHALSPTLGSRPFVNGCSAFRLLAFALSTIPLINFLTSFCSFLSSAYALCFLSCMCLYRYSSSVISRP